MPLTKIMFNLYKAANSEVYVLLLFIDFAAWCIILTVKELKVKISNIQSVCACIGVCH